MTTTTCIECGSENVRRVGQLTNSEPPSAAHRCLDCMAGFYADLDEYTKVGHIQRDDTDVYIGRSRRGAGMGDIPIGDRGWLGNPFPVSEYGRAEALDRFRSLFIERLDTDPKFREAVADLHGKTLGCWCRSVEDSRLDAACHGDTIAFWADQITERRAANGFHAGHK